MKIIGINIGANSQSPMGRGSFNSKDETFCYIPLEETEKQFNEFSYRDLNIPCIPQELMDIPCHYDPEFKTFTYGHIKRGYGDSILYDKELLDDSVYLMFYATLNTDTKWDVFAIGFFEVEKILDVRKLSDKEILLLEEFGNNAHLRRKEPGVDLLIKGTNKSKLFKRAIPFSDFQELITTSSGKKIEKKGPWYRWVYYSENEELLKLLTSQQ